MEIGWVLWGQGAQGLNYRIVKLSEKIASEYLFIEVILPDSKVLVGAYYKGPKVKELDLFEELLLDVTMVYEDVFIVGDFNENCLSSLDGGCASARCVNRTCTNCQFSDILANYGRVSIGTDFTHFSERPGDRPSLIDLFLTNRPDKVLFFKQISHGLSNHDIIFGSYVCNKRVKYRKPQFRRS